MPDMRLCSLDDIRSEFNNASAFKRSLYCCQALHNTNKARYQSRSARRALALLNWALMLQQVALCNVKFTLILCFTY